MEILTTTHAVQQWRQKQRQQGHTVGLVPTMGNLHEGHISLTTLTKQQADSCIVSIFVNPTQFGPSEDFEAYPRTWEADCAQLQDAGVEAVFAPQAEDVLYPASASTQVLLKPPHDTANTLCGTFRPGHFEGVLQVVNKLFNLTQPDYAAFGEKDYQQLTLIRMMARDFLMPIKILAGPIIREPSGLAMSSRNRYLSGTDRHTASQLSQLLYETRQAWYDGSLKSHTAQQEHCQTQYNRLNTLGFQMQYYALRRADTLAHLPTYPSGSMHTLSPSRQDVTESYPQELIVLAAGFLGKTRLIDNVLIQNCILA